MTAESRCIFCAIVAGKAEASVVHRDELVTAFMDVYPVNPGHTLVVPNHHSEGLEGVEEEVGGRIWAVARRIALSFGRAGILAEGVNLFLANGAVAGQTVFHCHLHVIPRHSGDGFGFKHGVFSRGRPGRAELDEQARKLALGLG